MGLRRTCQDTQEAQTHCLDIKDFENKIFKLKEKNLTTTHTRPRPY